MIKMKPGGTITPESYDKIRMPSPARQRFERDKREHRVYTLEDIDELELTDEEVEYVKDVINGHDENVAPDQLTLALYGLLQKLQDDLKIDDLAASKLIIKVSNTLIDEMHKDFDMNSFYAGAAWYSRELAKGIYEAIEEMQAGD